MDSATRFEHKGRTGMPTEIRRRCRHLSPRSAEILRAVIAAIRPRGHGFDQDVDEDVLAEIDRGMPYLPAPLRLSFPVGLRLLEWGAVVATPERARLVHLPREEALRYCEKWLHSRIGAFRTLLMGVRALVFLAFYQHPDVLKAMGVRWDERAEETIRLRAETLESREPGGSSV